MMIASEIVTDLDVLALDVGATVDFGDQNAHLDDKRRVAVEGWIAPAVEGRGLPPWRHRVRRFPDAVFTQISSAAADVTAAAGNATEDDVDLGATFTGGDATDALLVMHRAPYRALYFAVHEAPNAVAQVASPVVWTGAWTGVESLVDRTRVGTPSFARGGLIEWKPADDWQPRTYANTFGYWSKIHVGSLTSTTAARQVLPVTRSRLTYPAALYTLGLLYGDAWGSSRGDWEVKSQRYLDMAESALQRVLGSIEDEFDVDASGAVEMTEVNSVVQAEDYSDLTTWERA